MTATEVLRRLLDERGVEYVVDEEYGEKYPPEQRVTWSCDIAGEDMTVTARDYFIGDGKYCLDLEFHEVFTPEQAIAATLGSFNCTNGERTNGTCHDAAGEQMAFFSCSACGATIERKHPRFCFACGRKVVFE